MSEPEPRKAGKYELPRGASVGKYEILRKIATGGMAEIYLARVRGTAGFEKLVVLKRILPQVAEDPQFVQMFLDEARLSSTLQHPNIADVYDVGEADGQYFFTMEFVHGQDCRTIRHEMKKRNEPVPLAAALAIVHGTVSALDHAHNKRGSDGKPLGLVHRDVSASNVMVSYDGAVKLLDFGIARVLSTTHKTQVGTLKGKIPYMSPEQCKGLPLDRRSDLFSVGVVLFELTVGRRPFRGDSDFAIMDQIVYQGAPTPSSLMTGYPAELEAIVMKCLERDAKARYNTGDELVEDLEAFTQQFGLWISPKQLGKYMRTVFADRIKAWEDAEAAGVPFMQHVAESITSQSQQSELLTPPSAFPALPQRASQVIAAQSPEVVNSLRPTPPSMPVAEPPKSIDALHQKLGQKSVPPRSPTRQILAVTAQTAVPTVPTRKSASMPVAKTGPISVPKPASSPPPIKGVASLQRAPSPGPAPYTPPAQLPFQAPEKAAEGWDAPTTQFEGEPEYSREFAHESPTMSQPEEDLARALAADPDAGATMRAPSVGDHDLDAAATFQGMKAASAAKAPAKTMYGVAPAPVLTPPSRDEFSDDQATRRAPSPAVVRAPSPQPRPPSSGIDEDQITEKPLRIRPTPPSAFATSDAPLDAPAYNSSPPWAPEQAAVQAPAPMLQSAPVPSLKPSSSRGVMLALAAIVVIGGGIAGYVFMAGGGDTKSAPASLDQGSEVKATSTPVEPPKPAVAPEPTRPEPTRPAVAPEPTKPAPTQPAVAPEPTKPEPVKTEPAKPEPVKTEPVKTEPVKPEPAKTPVKTPIKQVTPVRPPVHKAPPANPSKHPKTDGKQDGNWDPNSPFLPGQ